MSDEMSQRSVRVAVSRIVLKYLMPVIAQHVMSRSFEQTIFLLPPTTHFKVLMSVRTEHLMWRSFDQAKFFLFLCDVRCGIADASFQGFIMSVSAEQLTSRSFDQTHVVLFLGSLQWML